jgi:hypothetical protein
LKDHVMPPAKTSAPAKKPVPAAKAAPPAKKAAAPAKKTAAKQAAPVKAAPQVTVTLKQIAAELAEGHDLAKKQAECFGPSSLMWTARGMTTAVFAFSDLISGLEAELCINGMNAPPFSADCRGQAPQPRSGASETPGLRSAIGREIIDLPSCIAPPTLSAARFSEASLLGSRLSTSEENPVSCPLMSGLSRGARRWPSWVCAYVSGTDLSGVLSRHTAANGIA